ncbi:hypothetical protein C8Q73DRAFT_788969 [Cubamyces lactineus]|nr:hypothetical protein C8Q73DRAFT_788969 [Cubamyces lactineus]
MARNEIARSGLSVLLDNLSVIEQRSFEATTTRTHTSYLLGDGTEVTFAKEGFTRSGISNIHYVITLVEAGSDTAKEKLTIYVRNPSPDDPSVNRRAVGNALEYLMSTGDTIRARDVDASTL